MKYYLGTDVGSSKTHALIADGTGQCVGFGKAWGGNYQGVGYDGLANVLQESFEQASQASGVSKDQIAGAGFGVAGYDFPSDRESHLQAIAALGLSCPVDIVNDGVNGLISGTSHGIGVNVKQFTPPGGDHERRGPRSGGPGPRLPARGAGDGERRALLVR